MRLSLMFQREIKMLRHLGWHENVISLYDVITMPYVSVAARVFTSKGRKDFTDIYIVTQLFECDLERIISSNQVQSLRRANPKPLSENHIQFFLFQLLKALKFLHSAKVLHRDLKPSNILVNSNCCLAICDFGLARGLAGSHSMMTEYVVTRWYRAPELLCENSVDTRRCCHRRHTTGKWTSGLWVASSQNYWEDSLFCRARTPTTS